MPNTTLDLQGRSLDKRQIFSRCGNSAISPLLAQTIQDAKDIMSNMVDHLDLAIGLYRNDGSGELRPDKLTSSQRTFDEHNAFASYRAFISTHYTGANAPGNLEGFETLRGTRKLAQTITDQLEKYLNGEPVRWIRGGFPYINLYCNDNKVLSRTNSNATGNDDTVITESGDYLYWVLQKSATLDGKESWVQRKLVCDVDPDDPDYDSDEDPDSDSDDDTDDEEDSELDDSPDDGPDNGPVAKTKTRFGVPVGDGLNAYTYKALYDTVEEIMVLCPSYHAQWLQVDYERSVASMHYRNLHVDVGQEPSDVQKQAAHDLLAKPDFHGEEKRGIKCLGDFLVQVFIHESTHAEAFTGGGNTLGQAVLVVAIVQG
ncbi:hypothetical protein FSOLCH5_008539 [Fusarium solani]